jgi:hypothetical protein
MGRDTDVGGLKKGPVIRYALSLRRRHNGRDAKFYSGNLGMMRPAHNPHLFWCGESNQRLLVGGGGACAGSGNGDAAGAGAAAALLGAFGFFGFSIFRAALGGGPAGWSSATTGLGSTVVDAGEEKSPGLRITCTGIVAGWNLFSV